MIQKYKAENVRVQINIAHNNYNQCNAINTLFCSTQSYKSVNTMNIICTLKILILWMVLHENVYHIVL